MELVRNIAKIFTPFLIATLGFLLNRRLNSLKINEDIEVGLKVEL
jgi:hypothetical protein